MSSTLVKLVRMANQIAAEFAYQQPGNAAAATHDHLWHFWDPAMIRTILVHLDAGGAGLTPAAAAAIARLRDPREPISQTRATEFAVGADGNSESDAG